jgi:hypothetical protein
MHPTDEFLRHAAEGESSETTRVHHAAGRRGGIMAAGGARAAGGDAGDWVSQRRVSRNDAWALRSSATKMGADVCIQTESLARTYERPALRKAFAAFPADTKVA